MLRLILSPWRLAKRTGSRAVRSLVRSASPVVLRTLFGRSNAARRELLGSRSLLRRHFVGSADVISWLDETAKRLRPTPETDNDLLIHGQLRAYAERVAPPAKYPELYADVPADLRRSIVQDGRTVNGQAPATALAGNTVTPELIVETHSIAQTEAIVVGVVLFLLLGLIAGGIALYLTWGMASAAFGTVDHALEQLRQQHHVVVDAWPGESPAAVAAPAWWPSVVAKTVAVACSSVAGLVGLILTFGCVGVFSYAFARLVWWKRFAGLFSAAVNQAVAPLRSMTGEAERRWRDRIDAREMEQAAYRSALAYINERDRSPFLPLGTAAGVFEFRGYLGAPQQSQSIGVSLMDLTQHALITGSSGEGKTRNVLRPLMSALVKHRAAGLPIAMFVMDDKAVLWKDLLESAAECGLDKEVRVIGTDDAHWRVDLLAGTPPTVVAEIIQSVARQAGGGGTSSNDTFWPEMASQLILEVATLLHCFEKTGAGREWARREGMRVYSLRNILRVAQSDALIQGVIADILAALKDPAQYPALAAEDGLALWSAIDAQLQAWVSLAEQTKSSILANARQTLRLFAFNPVISRGFGDGAGPNLMTVSELHGNHLTGIAISAVEHGSAGRLVLVALKSLLFREARANEVRDPVSAKKRLDWWLAPDPATADSSKAFTFFIADEYQGLATRVEDEAFAAIARSTGTALVLATQSVAAIETVLGREATHSLVNNMATKIFLRSTDLTTIDYARRLAGSAPRHEAGHLYLAESTVSAMREWGTTPEAMPKASVAEVRRVLERIHGASTEAVDAFEELSEERIDISDYGRLAVVPGAVFDGPADVALAAPWMAGAEPQELGEAMTEEFLETRWRLLTGDVHTAGNRGGARTQTDAEMKTRDVLSEQDLVQMGRGRAVVFAARGGITRPDIVVLNNA